MKITAKRANDPRLMYAYTISWMMSACQDVLLSWFRLGDSFVYMLIVFDGQNKQASDMPFLWANTGFSSKTLITVRKIPENIHNNRACNFRGSLNFEVLGVSRRAMFSKVHSIELIPRQWITTKIRFLLLCRQKFLFDWLQTSWGSFCYSQL